MKNIRDVLTVIVVGKFHARWLGGGGGIGCVWPATDDGWKSIIRIEKGYDHRGFAVHTDDGLAWGVPYILGAFKNKKYRSEHWEITT